MVSNESSNTAAINTNATSTSTTTTTTVGTKLCHIVKRPDFEGYGFNLHSEKVKPGQYIGKVDPNSPAELAGLKEGDRIIEVNGTLIENESHKQVVQRVKALSNEVRLMLIDVDGVKNTMSSSASTTTTTPATPTTPEIPNSSNAKGSNNNSNGNIELQHGTIQEIPAVSANIESISMMSTKRISNNRQSVSMNESDSSSAVLNNNGKSNNIPPPPSSLTASATSSSSSASASAPNNMAGSLQLPMTAAEMRIKLMSKKKYDPKNDSVDFKKKFDIIQKL